jgi:hypothetical protein
VFCCGHAYRYKLRGASRIAFTVVASKSLHLHRVFSGLAFKVDIHLYKYEKIAFAIGALLYNVRFAALILQDMKLELYKPNSRTTILSRRLVRIKSGRRTQDLTQQPRVHISLHQKNCEDCGFAELFDTSPPALTQASRLH